MDIPTLFVLCIAVTLLAGTLMMAYRLIREVFYGFDLWVAACFVLSLGYLFIMLRGAIPLSVSILAGNALLLAGAALRLDGVRRFLGNPPLGAGIYWALLVPFGLIAWFHFGLDAIALRSLILGLILFGIGVEMARELIVCPRAGNRAIRRVTAGITLLFCAVALGRSMVWLARPDDSMLTPGFINTLYFIFMALFEAGWGACFVLMNSRRLKSEQGF